MFLLSRWEQNDCIRRANDGDRRRAEAKLTIWSCCRGLKFFQRLWMPGDDKVWQRNLEWKDKVAKEDFLALLTSCPHIRFKTPLVLTPWWATLYVFFP